MMNYLGGPNVMTRSLMQKREAKEEVRAIRLLALKMEGGHKPRNVGSL